MHGFHEEVLVEKQNVELAVGQVSITGKTLQKDVCICF